MARAVLADAARVARWADDHPDVPVQIHLAEMDSEMEWCAKNHGMRPVEVVEKAGLLRKGLICAHCLHVSDSDIAKMAHAQVCVAHNARSNAKAGRGIAPVEAMRKAGIPVGIATDGPMSGNTLDLFSQFAPVTMFQKLLEERERNPGLLETWFSTHPTTQERIDNVQSIIASLPAGSLQGLNSNSQAFVNFRSRVRSLPASASR